MVSIVEVTTKAQLRKFVDYPNRLVENQNAGGAGYYGIAVV